MIIEKAGLSNFDYFWIKMLLNSPSRLIFCSYLMSLALESWSVFVTFSAPVSWVSFLILTSCWKFSCWIVTSPLHVIPRLSLGQVELVLIRSIDGICGVRFLGFVKNTGSECKTRDRFAWKSVILCFPHNDHMLPSRPRVFFTESTWFHVDSVFSTDPETQSSGSPTRVSVTKDL